MRRAPRARFFAALLACAASLVACRGERVEVLRGADAGTPAPFRTCAEALARGRDGDACEAFTGADVMGCSQTLGCCTTTAFCESGALLVQERCEGCAPCAADADCAIGLWCVGEECVICPIVAEPSCDPPLEPFLRNGCPTQECAPVGECTRDEDCGGAETCAQGLRCACTGPGCCVGLCVEDALCPDPDPLPEGCVRPCGSRSCPTGMCIQTGCQCSMNSWLCEEVCASSASPSC